MRRALAGVLLAAPLLGQAAPADYRCEDQRVLRATTTPHTTQVELGGQRWTLSRVRDAREALFVNPRQKVRLIIKRSDLSWQSPQGTLQCRLIPQSMRAEDLYVAPAALPGAR